MQYSIVYVDKMKVPIIADIIVENVTRFVADAMQKFEDSLPGD